jgi:hypothetical protein
MTRVKLWTKKRIEIFAQPKRNCQREKNFEELADKIRALKRKQEFCSEFRRKSTTLSFLLNIAENRKRKNQHVMDYMFVFLKR